MKITKKIAASEAVQVSGTVQGSEEVVDTIPADTTSVTSELNDMVMQDAKGYINSAIKSLGAFVRKCENADDKAKAKEAIANLGVVLLSLQ